MSAYPPYLTVGTEVSAKYKGAFCEAKIKKCQKSVKCKVSPKDGGPQISVTDDAIQGELRIGSPVKVRQPDSGQIIDGSISRIIDSSIYTVVFDDGDIVTLKRTQICLKGDKHFMESDTLDRLPLTNPEHFSTPVNLLKKERRRRSGVHASPSGTVSEESDDDSETTSKSRRISPRGTKTSVDNIGKVISLEQGDKRKWAPALVIKPLNHESDMKNKGLMMVKSFRDNKIYTVSEKQVREFNKETIKSYPDEKLTKLAVDKAMKYTNTKELPASWKRDEILGQPPADVQKGAADFESDINSESSSNEEEEDKSDMFIARLYKFMDDRSTPINKPAQLYNRDVNLYKLYHKAKTLGGFNKVSASGKWKDVANKLGFTGISAGTEMKLLYRRYLVAFEEFHRKMGDTHMFEVSRGQRRPAAGGRSVMSPRDREAQHVTSVSDNKASTSKSSTKETVDKKTSTQGTAKVKSEPVEDTLRRTPSRQASKKDDKEKVRRVESPKPPDSPGTSLRASRGRPGPPTKQNIKLEKAAKLDLDKDDEKMSVTSRASTSPAPPGGKHRKNKLQDESDIKMDDDSIMSDEESTTTTTANSTVSVDVDYPPGTKLKVRYGRGRNIKIYEAKVMDVRMNKDSQLLYSVHYAGWNIRYDEVISNDRIVGASGRCEKKRMQILRDGFGAKSKKSKSANQTITSASSTGSRTPEPPSGRSSSAGQKITPRSACMMTPKPSVPTVTGASATPANRSTRSSLSDISLPRPTRSKSTDSNLSTGLPNRKVRPKKSSLVDEDVKPEPADQDQEETTEEESSVADLDMEKSDTVTKEMSKPDNNKPVPPDVKPVEVEEMKICENKPSSPMSEMTNEEADDVSISSDRTPRRTGRRHSKQAITAPPVSVVQTSTQASVSVVSSDQPPSKRVKRTESPVVPTLSSSAVMMTSDMRTRMYDVIDRVAEGEITTNIDELLVEDEESGEASPPVKRKKMEREGSSSSLACEEAFVKIEPLKHKKPTQEGKQEQTKSEHGPEDEDEDSNLKLPPLMKSGAQPDNKGSRSPTDDGSRPESEQSYSSDYDSKAVSSTLSNRHETVTSNTTISESTTSNLSLLSEQASLSKTDSNQATRSKQRAGTRRQQAKRSPRPKHSGHDSHGLDMLADEAATANDKEVSHITSAASSDRTSPNKPLKSALPRPPRQPRYNFKIEEELAEISDQDLRISYLMDKLSEIRSLYTDVKSNLASIERKRKRVRQRDRDLATNYF